MSYLPDIHVGDIPYLRPMARSKVPTEDPRSIPVLLEEKKIMTFGDIFHFFPRTTVARHLGMDFVTFTRRLLDPESFTILQIHQLADLFHLSREEMDTLLNRHIREVKKGGWQVPKMDYRGRENLPKS